MRRSAVTRRMIVASLFTGRGPAEDDATLSGRTVITAMGRPRLDTVRGMRVVHS